MDGLDPAVYMVVAQEVEHRMGGEVAHFPLERVAVELRLFDRLGHRDNDVPQERRAGRLVVVVDAVFPEGEGEDVGGGVDVAVLFIEFADLVVVDKGNRDFRVLAELFQTQGGVAGAPHQEADTGRDFDDILAV